MNGAYSETFMLHEEKWRGKRLALYGTGVIATEILTECHTVDIVGVYDRDLRSGTIQGVDILDIHNIEVDKIEIVVIAAQPENVYAIYSRIYDEIEAAKAAIYDIQGEDLCALYGNVTVHFDADMHCFSFSRDELMEQIEDHDIISFDIFDTLLMRRVYEPHDVFFIVQERAKEQGLSVPDLYRHRVQAEINLIQEIPTLAQLYDEFQKLTGITDTIKERLMQIEIDAERDVIILRKEMGDIWKRTIDLGKPVYLLSDMYLPTELLEDILRENGIKGHKKLYNSCDFHKPKVNGLFEIFCREVKGKRYLHIGDHAQADGTFANKAGMDSFVITKASLLCEQSSFREMRKDIQTWNERLLFGLFTSCLFNSPFCIEEDGRVIIDDVKKFAFCCVAPVIACFIRWLEGLQEKEKEEILFSSRDGWLMKKIMERSGKEHRGIYFYTSRTACLSCKSSAIKKENYERYLKKVGVDKEKEYLFFDLVSSGTCLSLLVENFGLKLRGAFLYRYDTNNRDKGYLNISSYLPDDPHSSFWRHYKFFEVMLTSDEPSVIGFDNLGEPVFEKEYRSDDLLRFTAQAQDVIIYFFDIYRSMCDGSYVAPALLDKMVAAMDKDRSCIKDKMAKEIYLYDSYGVGRIDIFDPDSYNIYGF